MKRVKKVSEMKGKEKCVIINILRGFFYLYKKGF